ncbi:MAG: T9SS type A sorting domain-containing protein [bacterium]
MKLKYFFFLLLISITASFGQNVFESESVVSELTAIIPQLQHLQKKIKYVSPQDNDLIIGQDDPEEEVTISGDFYQNGNIIIYNHGILNLEDADFRINGGIFITGQGQLNVRGGSFTIIQNYIYEHQAILLEKGILMFSQVDFHSSAQSWNITLLGNSQYSIKDSEISDGFITVGLLQNSTASITNTKRPGEFLCLGNNTIEINNSDFLLQWLVLTDTSKVDTSLPDGSLVTDWQFSDKESGIDNIPYSLKIDSCTNVLWGLISITGSEAVFRDTEFRTVGLMFNAPDSTVVSNITNKSSHTDDLVTISDRTLRLINSHVLTWSFYVSQHARLAVNNCVFGELLSQDSSRVVVDNSVCDGTGGYLGALNNSFLMVTRSFVSSQVISRDRGVLVGAESAFWGSHIAADESSIMFLANTARSIEPQAHSSAVIFEALLPYVEGNTESIIPVTGSARILSGLDNPIEFDGYEFFYSKNTDDPLWDSIDGFHTQPVVNDTLGLWNTTGLTEGNYLLQLSIHHNLGESISMNSWARLNTVTNISDLDSGYPEEYSVGQNYPNPFNASTTIPFYVPASSTVTLKVYDVCGRIMTSVTEKDLSKGFHRFDLRCDTWSSGVYYYQVQAGAFSEVRRFLLLK